MGVTRTRFRPVRTASAARTVPAPSRRSLLVGGAVLLGAAACGGGGSSPPAAPTLRPATPIPGVTDGVFALGVASGDPLPDAVILWTRLAAQPTVAGGGMPNRDIEVDWQIATDEKFASVVAVGTAPARAALAHSVHVDAKGLEPGREYFYRFRAGTVISPVGRTRTALAAGSGTAAGSKLSLALASCQDYEEGYWPAHGAIAADRPDLVLFVGDYIYEGDPAGRLADRRHTAPATPGLGQLSTLDDYRARYGQYKSDPQLQAAHHAAPWVVTWDDHEVENNYAGLVDESRDTGPAHQEPEAFARERAAGYQAYYEHMPIRVDYTPGSPDLRLYRRFGYGDLLDLAVMDTRQYRTPPPGRPADGIGPAVDGHSNTTGTMAGDEQERWLVDGLRASSARWNVIAQQTMMAQVNAQLPVGQGEVLANLDQNDGYGPYRSRLLAEVRDSGATNPVVLSGDIHCAWVNDLRVDFDAQDSPVVATEFVCTSVSSAYFLVSDEFVTENNARFNPHVRYFRGDRRGYTRITVTPDECRADMRTVQTIDQRDAPTTTDATWVIENGRPGAQRA
ncbi:alkaline phosphatase D family protein [Frankia sp. CNm7]|uniref:Alkaline phosphatase D family protein n=1 Tax=Frankia nepalensis TaxID=1836974 RepID=A0A937RI41_9ACTN|nr:alkaline phosphatase D family protein [Frankia nepalensis]MBL7495933.1 alkaline phosphatase D family protein [Frankia nepalensis]MBL7513594.1 alkaline phosphatase D family protein [Frankia nepalensis]MBL7524024.1 alkaline phosphatase D family protein [Frankia nepalensis]MBL7632658.1 alkaline phosphatase D family protein [Frankia nepalensis]